MGNSTRIREAIKRSLRIPDSCENCNKCIVEVVTPNCEEPDYKTYYCKIGKFKNFENRYCDYWGKKEEL